MISEDPLLQGLQEDTWSDESDDEPYTSPPHINVRKKQQQTTSNRVKHHHHQQQKQERGAGCNLAGSLSASNQRIAAATLTGGDVLCDAREASRASVAKSSAAVVSSNPPIIIPGTTTLTNGPPIDDASYCTMPITIASTGSWSSNGNSCGGGGIVAPLTDVSGVPPLVVGLAEGSNGSAWRQQGRGSRGNNNNNNNNNKQYYKPPHTRSSIPNQQQQLHQQQQMLWRQSSAEQQQQHRQISKHSNQNFTQYQQRNTQERPQQQYYQQQRQSSNSFPRQQSIVNGSRQQQQQSHHNQQQQSHQQQRRIDQKQLAKGQIYKQYEQNHWNKQPGSKTAVPVSSGGDAGALDNLERLCLDVLDLPPLLS